MRDVPAPRAYQRLVSRVAFLLRATSLQVLPHLVLSQLGLSHLTLSLLAVLCCAQRACWPATAMALTHPLCCFNVRTHLRDCRESAGQAMRAARSATAPYSGPRYIGEGHWVRERAPSEGAGGWGRGRGRRSCPKCAPHCPPNHSRRPRPPASPHGVHACKLARVCVRAFLRACVRACANEYAWSRMHPPPPDSIKQVPAVAE